MVSHLRANPDVILAGLPMLAAVVGDEPTSETLDARRTASSTSRSSGGSGNAIGRSDRPADRGTRRAETLAPARPALRSGSTSKRRRRRGMRARDSVSTARVLMAAPPKGGAAPFGLGSGFVWPSG